MKIMQKHANGKALSLYEIGEHEEEIDCYDRQLKLIPNFQRHGPIKVQPI